MVFYVSRLELTIFKNLILDKIKQNKNLNIKNNKFHKLNLNKTEILGLLKSREFEVLKHYYVTNMPLLFHLNFLDQLIKNNSTNMLEEKKVIN